MRCADCKHWGTGDGTGYPYDAGPVNYCKQEQISGVQHPSYGACGDRKSMLMIEGTDKPQLVLTRGTFGCVLFEARKIVKVKGK